MKKRMMGTMFLIVLTIPGIFTACGKKHGEFLTVAETMESTAEAFQEEEEVAEAPIQPQELCVYVCGEVNEPGVYTFSEGTRLYEAIASAGGFTQAAEENYWNLAMVLSDCQMVYVPSKEEVVGNREGGLLAVGQADDVSSCGGTLAKTDATDSRVNINTADEAKLMTIPGIGATRAKSIVDYRQTHGTFSKVEDITKVSGIKGATFAKIEEYITVD